MESDPTVHFKALPKPAGASWPSGQPVWSGTAGVTGTGDTKSKTFSTVPPGPASYYTVVAASCGIEVTVKVYVTDLSASDITSRRTSAPVEASAYRVKSHEHFEIGGTFAFELDTDGWRVPDNLMWEVWETSCIHSVVESGSGDSFSLYMSPNLGLQDDGGVVRFHADNNNSGDSTTGVNDPHKDTPEFIVKELQAVTLNVEYSDQLTGVGPGSISTHIENAEIDARVKDSADDYRACVCYAIGTCTEFTASTSRPDPVGDSYEQRAKHYDEPSQVVIVQDLEGTGVGYTYNYDMNCIIVEWRWVLTYKTLGHEIGHGLNCDDTYNSHQYIMYGYGIYSASLGDHLTQSEAEEFSDGD